MRERSWCGHGGSSRHRVLRENRRREEDEAELEEEAKGERWAIVRREYNISLASRMRSTRCGLTCAVDGIDVAIYLGIEGRRVDSLLFAQRHGKLHQQKISEDTATTSREVVFSR